MTGHRQTLALGPPPASLSGFPRWTLAPDRRPYRAHDRARGPWWFSPSLAGWFDLPAPEGACYLAGSAEIALRERLGRPLVARGVVLAADVADVVVSALHVPERHRLADLCSSGAARFGVTREIHVLTPYALTQAWAVALRVSGLAGLRYDARFSTGRSRSYALWGAEGERAWPIDRSPAPARDVAAGAGIAVLSIPASVPLLPPPA